MAQDVPRKLEKALIVGLECQGNDRWDVRESLDELAELAATAGAEVVGRITQRLQQPTAPYYIGKGKAEEVKTECGKSAATSVIFDDELSPAQGRNLEKLTARKVLDRTQLILDIFAQRARTREGRLQIELAQLQYLLPRLTRMWGHLSRQSGGIGTRGPGETQLEVDRRRVQERIARLDRELAEVRKHRGIQREGRRRHRWPLCAIVGYTNAGKSTLLNQLTGAGVLAADQLFATLDPTTRQIVLPNKQRALLTDTVGFIKKLPHQVIESFKATLEEVVEADLLIHVADVAHPRFEDQIAAVDSVIREIHADGKETLLVFNKIDRIDGRDGVDGLLRRYPGAVAVSARTGEGFAGFAEELQRRLAAWRMHAAFRIPACASGLLAEIHRVGHVISLRWEGDEAVLEAHVPPALEARLAPYAHALED
jgi:GTP-binding protein HflX